jgi:signal transduction histidine kinase
MVVRKPEWNRRALPSIAFVVVAAVLTLALLQRSPVFMMTAGCLYCAIFARVPSRWGTGVALLYSGCLFPLVYDTFGRAFAHAFASVVVASAVFAAFISAVVSQSRKNRELLEQLAATQASLLRAEGDAAAARERQRASRELHDTVIQDLIAIVLQLENAGAGHVSRERATHTSLAIAKNAVKQARRMIANQDPCAENLSLLLPTALEAFERETSVATHAMIEGDVDELAPEQQRVVLRFVQEALANARKHARASRLDVSVCVGTEAVLVDVADDGVGFDVEAPRSPSHDGGFGLHSMAERVSELGGELRVESEPGAGTTLALHLPRRPDRQSGGSS